MTLDLMTTEELSFPGTLAPRNESSMELSFPGTFAPWNFRSLNVTDNGKRFKSRSEKYAGNKNE